MTANQSSLYIFLIQQPPSYAQNLYDAIMFYAVTVNDTLALGQDYRNGTTIRMNMGNKVFASKFLLFFLYHPETRLCFLHDDAVVEDR